MAEAHHPIKTVVRRTGLSAHVIRIWEKRYQAVKPERTETNRRLYSSDQIERLSLLRAITRAGHNIGPIAKLPTDRLRKLAAEAEKTDARDLRGATDATGKPSILDECIAAVNKLDDRALDSALKRGATEFGAQGVLQRVIAPLSQTMGELWRDGSITAAHEHFASAVIRIFLGHAARPFAGSENAPVLVVATPAGQIHELGALIASASAANLGWRVIYLGASLPAAEIAGVARQNLARAVALSLVYPEDDPRLEEEMIRLHESLPTEVALLVGGRAMPAYREALDKVGATQIKDLTHFCSALDGLRKPHGKTKR